MNGKRTLLFIIIFVVAICSLIVVYKSYSTVWYLWQVPDMTPHFFDLRNLTEAADAIASGYDPLYQNQGDPSGRPFNRPRLVQHIISALKVNPSHTTAIGISFISLFILGIFIAFKRFNNRVALFLAIVLFSPAVMLGVERGQSDLFIFFIVSLALSMSNLVWISLVVILFASFIKLFPVFAISYFLKYERNKFLLFSLGFTIIFLGYLGFNHADLQQIFSSTQKGSGLLAYGSRSHALDIELLPSLVPPIAILISCIIFYIEKAKSKGLLQSNTDYIDAFRVGAAIYVGTFFLGNNWAYRLMFLIFTIPQLVTWLNDNDKRFVSIGSLASIIISCWTLWFKNLLPEQILVTVDEIANWLTFSLLCYMLISTLPTWLQSLIVRTNAK